MACHICGEDRFANAAQGICHSIKNHAFFSCSCGKKFLEQNSLVSHQKHQERNKKAWVCSVCCRSFNKKEGLFDHQRVKDHWQKGEKEKYLKSIGKVLCDDKCGRSFSSKEALDQHREHYRNIYGTQNVCHGCTKTFSSQDFLDQHQRDTGHINVRNNPKRAYIDGFIKARKVAVDRTEKKESVACVKTFLDDLIKEVREQPGGKMYSADLRKAGSHAAGTKIGKPNEFDTNIPINIDVKDIKTRGSLPYIYEDKVKDIEDGHSPNNLNVERSLVDNPSGKIPIGSARVIVDKDSESTNLTYNGDLIAHKVLADFHKRVADALVKLGRKDVFLSKNAHGPALTVTMKKEHGHDINIDLTPCLPCKEPVTANGWPRPDTLKALPADVIEHVKSSGMHLVPKGGEAWTLSYSKAETAIFNEIDRDNGCLKDVLKYCKRKTELCASRSENGLPGVSSHIIKHAVLWCRELQGNEGYWHQRNKYRCLIDTLKYTEDALKAGKIPNYFDTKENILKGKDRAVLNTLAKSFKEERYKLMHL